MILLTEHSYGLRVMPPHAVVKPLAEAGSEDDHALKMVRGALLAQDILPCDHACDRATINLLFNEAQKRGIVLQ